MKQSILLLVILILSLNGLSAQHSKKKNRSINFSSSLNFMLPNEASYSWSSQYRRAKQDFDLTFTTPNSGVFEVETDTVAVRSSASIEIPAQLIGIGMSLQIKNLDNIFHEFSIPRLSFQKVQYSTLYQMESENLGYSWTNQGGRAHKSFAFAFRYEIGKYFGDPVYAKMNFGLSAAIGTSFLSYFSEPPSSLNFPIRGHQINFDFAFIPSMQFKLNKALAMDFKVIPYFVIEAINNVERENPSLLPRQRRGTLDTAASKLNLTLSLHLRYTIKYIDRKKKKRKRRRR